MLWTIVKKEAQANLVSFRFILIFLLCCTLILVSAYTMRDKYNHRVEEYSAALKIHKQELAQAAGKRGVPNRYKLDKPPKPLSVIVEGMEGAAGKFATVGILSTPKLEGGSGSDPAFAYFGTLDMMYIVRVVLSLVAILLTYDAISGERERGTLALVLSNSIPRSTVLLAKCISGYITLLLPFLAPLLLGLLILTTSGNINFSSEDWSRLGLVLLASLLYIGFFLMLGLLVSSLTNRSNTALMLLLFIWVVIVLAVPKVSMIIADKLSDVPSVQAVQSEKDAVSGQLWGEMRKRLAQYKQEHRNIGDAGLRMQGETGINIAKRRWELQSEYDRKKMAQFRLAANISRLSPASVYTYAATSLAGTGFNRQEDFIKAARSYQVGVAQYYYDAFLKGENFEPDKLPTLKFRESTLSESWHSVSLDVLILFLLVTCFFMLAYVSFIRSDVR